MITEKYGDLLNAGDVDVIFHCCNLFHSFGAGIALQIKKKFPEALEADKATIYGDREKLGTYSVGMINKPKSRIKYVYNIYAMTGLGTTKRQLSYDALVKALENTRNEVEELFEKTGVLYTIGMPHGMGSCLAGGDWAIVRTIIESIFGDSEIDVKIYKYES